MGFPRLSLRAPARLAAAERIVERADDRPRLVAGDAVIDRLAVPARGDQAFKPEARQLLRHRRLPPRQERLQFADRPLSVQEIAKDHQSGLMGQRLEKLARLAGALRHTI